MDNALFGIGIADIADAERRRIAFERGQLLRAFAIGNGDALARGIASRGGRQIVIGHRQRQIGAAHRAPGQTQRLERLRAGHFMDQVPVDIDQAGAVIAAFNNVGVPDLLVQRARMCRGHSMPVKPEGVAFQGRFALGNGQATNRTV